MELDESVHNAWTVEPRTTVGTESGTAAETVETEDPDDATLVARPSKATEAAFWWLKGHESNVSQLATR